MTDTALRLGVFLATRMARSPALCLATAGGTAHALDPPALPTWLQVVERLCVASVVVGAGAFVPAVTQAVREARYPTPACPVNRRTRLAALLLAATLVALAGCAVLHLGTLTALWWSPLPGGIAGRVPWEALGLALLAAVAGGVGGVLVGTWVRSWQQVVLPWGPVLGIVLIGVWWEVVPAYAVLEVAVRVLNPTALDFGPTWMLVPVPYAVLVLLLAAAVAATLLRLQPGPRHRAVAAGMVAVLLAGAAHAFHQGDDSSAVRAGVRDRLDAMWPSATERAPPETPRGARECRARHGVEYCAYPDYQQWIPVWRATVAPVARALPARARGDLPTVAQQYPREPDPIAEDASQLRGGVVVPDPRWDDGYSKANLVEQVTLAAVGAPSAWADCTLAGQSRSLVVFWLLDQAREAGTPDIDASMVQDGASTGELAMGVAMTRAPDRDIRRAMATHWRRLVDPDISARRAARLLDVRVTGADLRTAREQWRPLDDGEELPQCP